MTACPVCASSGLSNRMCHRRNQLPSPRLPARTRDTLVECSACGFAWIEPPPDLTDLIDGYRATPVSQWDATDKALRREWPEKVRQLQHLVSAGRVLDVGCFTGAFLECWPPAFERWGVELSEAAAAMARSRRVHVVEGDVLTVDLPDAHFHVIVAADVLEHVADQDAFVARLRRWLAPGGVLAIETGDRSAPFARLMGARWYYYSIVEHVAFHTGRSLDLLMARHGLVPEVRERRWHEAPLSLAHTCRRMATGAAFKVGAGLAARIGEQWLVPPAVGALARRPSPWHATRDHLWHVYRSG